MRKIVYIAAAVLVVLFVFLEFVNGGFMGCGDYPLSVDVVPESDPPTRVSCKVVLDEQTANLLAELPKLSDEGGRVTTADPFKGKPLEVSVFFDEEFSLILHRTNRWAQYEWLVVFAEWDDGRRVAKAVHIPDGRTTRTMRVELP